MTSCISIRTVIWILLGLYFSSTFLWPVAEVTYLPFDLNLDCMMFNQRKPLGSLFMHVRTPLKRRRKRWRIKFLLASKIAPQKSPPRRSSNCSFSNIAFRSNLSATLTLVLSECFCLKTVNENGASWELSPCILQKLYFTKVEQSLVPW